MNELQIPIEGNLTLHELGNNPNTYPEENMTANIIRRMDNDNATKLKFINTKGEEKTLTLKKGSMKLNKDIKDYDKYIEKAGYVPEMLGKMIFQPFPWKEMKEIRKQGGELQVLVDEIYKEGQPSLTVE